MPQKFVVYGLRETYHELGDYEFKIVLDPKYFKNCHQSVLSIVDSDGNQVPAVFKIWGRKINCQFRINSSIPDGVATVKMLVKDDDGSRLDTSLRFWIIKP